MTAGQQNGSSTRDGSATNEIRAPLDIGIAIHANDPDAVPAILQRLSDFGKTPDISIDDTRVEMLANARALVRALETPRETMIKHNWAQVSPELRTNGSRISDSNKTSAWLSCRHHDSLPSRRFSGTRKRTGDG